MQVAVAEIRRRHESEHEAQDVVRNNGAYRDEVLLSIQANQIEIRSQPGFSNNHDSTRRSDLPLGHVKLAKSILDSENTT